MGSQISNSVNTLRYHRELLSLHRWQALLSDLYSTTQVRLCSCTFTLLANFHVQVMITIIKNNREVLLDPVGTRVVSILRLANENGVLTSTC